MDGIYTYYQRNPVEQSQSRVDWPGDDNGTASQTIEIVNGSFVTTNFDSFAIGENFTLTVTVKDMDEDAVKIRKRLLGMGRFSKSDNRIRT